MPLSVQADDLQGLGDVNGEKFSGFCRRYQSVVDGKQHTTLVSRCSLSQFGPSAYTTQPTTHDPRSPLRYVADHVDLDNSDDDAGLDSGGEEGDVTQESDLYHPFFSFFSLLPSSSSVVSAASLWGC